MRNPIINFRTQSRKTLVFCPIGLGNFIMAAPALKVLSEEVGRENLHILALKSGIRLMAEQSGWFEKVHYWDPDSGSLLKGIKKLTGLRREQFDYSISLFPTGHWKFSLFSFFCNSRKKIGFEYKHTGIPSIVQDVSIKTITNRHDSEQNLSLVQHCLGIPQSFPGNLILPLNLSGLDEIQSALREHCYYVCHPGSSLMRDMDKKRLPAATFSEIIQKIFNRFSCKCLLIGGPEEESVRNQIRHNASAEAFVDLHTYDLNELAVYIHHSRFYLGNDSGLMHMAAASGKKCIAFFGPSDERRTGPYYLEKPGHDVSDDVSRGHLVIRHPDDKAPVGGQKVNPRMRYADSDGLRKLKTDWIWNKTEPFIEGILR